MRFAVLGPVLVDGRPPRGAIERALLTRLLVANGAPVSAGELIEAGWPPERRAGAAASLRVRLAKLRAELEPGRAPGAPAQVLVREPAGYRLAAPPGSLDTEEFARLADEAARLPAKTARECCERALALWRGDPFADLDLAEAAAGEALRLHGVRDRLRHLGALALLDMGQAQDAARELAAAASEQFIDLRLGDRDDQADVNVPGGLTTVRGEAGSDIYFGGTAPGVSRVDFRGGSEIDLASYAKAGSFVRVKKDEDTLDGRAGDKDNIRRDVENVLGSRFDDTLVGWSNPVGTQESFDGTLGDDFMAGLGGSDQFETRAAPEGADEVRGGDGNDYADYFSRTTGVTVTLDHADDESDPDGDGNDDGEAGENDDVREVEEVAGGRGNDDLEAAPASTTPVLLFGLLGDDRVTGGAGDDELIGEGIGGAGRDAINGRGGDDNIAANAVLADPDFIDCGTGFDSLQHDPVETAILNCEDRLEIGRLELATPRTAQAGETARLDLRWRHPDGWKQLREIELRLASEAQSAGEVSIRPRTGRVSGDGIRLVRSRLGRDGKWVSARLVVRLGDHLAGRTLKADVEATDVRGRRQVEVGAARIRVSAR